jgi:hypothetical protein
VRIENVGSSDLVVSSVDVFTASPEEVSLDLLLSINGALPWTVASSGSIDFEVVYVGLDTFTDTAFVSVISNDPFRPEVVVTANGTGAEYVSELDLFTADGGPSFTLSRQAVEPTLDVRVDGVAVTKGWTYSLGSSTVVFGTAPKSGSTVEIAYEVLPSGC